MKINKLIVLLLSCLLLISCNNKPKMASDQKNKGVVQEMDVFDVEASAENFRKNSREFNDTNLRILNRNAKVETTSRRVVLQTQKKSTRLSIIDHNLPIKNLEDDLVTFKFNNIDLKSALKLFASTVKRNIIIGNEVQGNLIMDFEDIKWGSAVYAVLDMNNLVMTEDKQSGLLRVHSSEQFKVLAESKIEQTKDINASLASLDTGSGSGSENEENTISEIFKIFYQTSADIITPLTAAVGDSVIITDDPQNNQLIVTASLKDLDKVDLSLQELDIQKRQVMVEAYIINATDNFTKNFNANLSTYQVKELQTGQDGITFAGIDSNPSDAGTEFNTSNTTSENLPNTSMTDAATVAGGAFLLGNLGITKLKAIIQASNTDNNAETISNPKLFAMDGESATLVQGITLLKVIPAAGDAAGSVQEVNQNLNITITPRIISDDEIKLELSISNDSPGESSGDTVTTNTESITSIVQIETGDVAILGGVYKNNRTDNIQYVPFLSSIPILGSFFKQKTKSDGKSQLLIFLTANIV
jgi:type IV pilus assembly protein PilQ